MYCTVAHNGSPQSLCASQWTKPYPSGQSSDVRNWSLLDMRTEALFQFLLSKFWARFAHADAGVFSATAEALSRP